MLNRIPYLVLTLVFFIGGLSLASDLKVAVISLEKAVGKAEAIKKINAQLDEEFKKEREDLKELRSEIEKLEKKIKEKEKPDDKLEGELRRRRIQYSYFFEAVSEKADKRHEELMAEINPLVKQAIKDITEQYDIVYDGAELLHFNPSLEITDRLTQKINDSTKNIKP